MLDLLSSFSIGQIVIFIIVFAIAVKELIDFIFWLKGKMDIRDSYKEEKQNNIERLGKLEKNIDQLSILINDLTEKVDLLISSDKDDIKSYITKEHHFLCYEQHWVDDYTLDCIEKRYDHYIEENGNSFVEHLMDEIRALPKKPMEDNNREL